MNLYTEVVNRGIPHANHFSDLYLPDTAEVRRLLRECGSQGTPFVNRVEGGIWLDVPFAYLPYWEEKARVL